MAAATDFPLTGGAFFSQMEHEYMSLHKLSVCSGCFAIGFQKPLKRCNACRLVDYCSKDCQKRHWSKHKQFCNMVQGKGPKSGYLSRLKTPEDLYKVLIDSYRLRANLDHAQRQENHGIYRDDTSLDDLVWSQGDAEDDFQTYLDLAETAGVLPAWWRFENRMECLAQAVDKKDEGSIYSDLDQDEMMTRYEGDLSIRAALFIIAELIVGYDGKGSAVDGQWYADFQEHLETHPEEKARMMQGTIKAVEEALPVLNPQQT